MASSQLLPPVTRTAGGAEAFGRLLARRWSQPFEWGVNDCCMWAADAVLVQTGLDFAARLRGTYSNAANAGRLVRRLGGMARIATAALGQPLPHALLARVGDVGLSHSGALVVCIGEHWTVPGPRGLGLLPLADVVKAWRVA